MPVLVVNTSLGETSELMITPLAYIAVAMTAAPALIAGPVASAARMIGT
jgi:hypothetical protein